MSRVPPTGGGVGGDVGDVGVVVEARRVVVDVGHHHGHGGGAGQPLGLPPVRGHHQQLVGGARLAVQQRAADDLTRGRVDGELTVTAAQAVAVGGEDGGDEGGEEGGEKESESRVEGGREGVRHRIMVKGKWTANKAPYNNASLICSFTHRWRCQPWRAIASSRGAVRVRCLTQRHFATSDQTSDLPVTS